MRIKNKEYNEEYHDKFHALSVKQPYADLLVEKAFADECHTYAKKSIEVRSYNTNYRGDLLICSCKKPEIEGRMTGCTIGNVELYDTKRIEDFTEYDWASTQIPEEERSKYTHGYGWLMRNPRRVVELPLNGQLGIFTLCWTKGEIIEYPRNITLDNKGWQSIKDKQDATRFLRQAGIMDKYEPKLSKPYEAE